MPFTPLHMGPGALFKAGLGRYFSLLIFGWSQIIVDLQPLVAILRDQPRLHGWTHTYLAALGLGIVAAVSGRWGLSWLGRLWGVGADTWMARYVYVSWTGAFLSAWIGTFSHVLIDSVMHWDMLPFSPSTATSSLLGLLETPQLYRWCKYAGVIGGSVALWRENIAYKKYLAARDKPSLGGG